MSDKGIKSIEIVQQLDFLNYDLSEFENRIKSLTNIKDWCYIVHDSDLDDNNEIKSAHIHCVLTFHNSTRISVLSNCLEIPQQYFNFIKTTVSSAKAYLIHLNDKDKYQYSCDSVVANFNYHNFIEKLKSKSNKKDIADRIFSGEIKEYNLLNYISIDDYAKNKMYYSRCFEYRQNYLINNNRDLMCMFVTGESGNGKTTFAKEYCQKMGYSTYISSGGNNLFDDYKGQEAIILDDLRSSSISFNDLLKLSDNNTNSLVGCRFYNKSIFECKLLIITSSIPITKFYPNLFENNEQAAQLYRRFPLYVHITKDLIKFNFYRNGVYMCENEFDNYITAKYKQNNEKAVDLACSIIENLGLIEYVDPFLSIF